jgi:superfamily II DNA or RNA helicase
VKSATPVSDNPAHADGAGAANQVERQMAALRRENQRLRNLLKIAHGVEPPPAQPELATSDPGALTAASSREAKLDLYWRLFAARRDVYARYWEFEGKKGWSPATRDRYREGASVWDRRPYPLTPEVVDQHILGKRFIGLFPLLADSTCWWLAADFDGSEAMLDAHAYAKAAFALGIPCALEVSQSGKGAHAWTFFSEPVPAADARAMGSACIQTAMRLPGSMPLSSYDRLFPNQDAAPKGKSGIGNLIAAPLNGRRVDERHTTMFLDQATWEPLEDQWEYLSTIGRMTPREVAAAASTGRRIVVGPPVTRVERSAATVIDQPLPDAVRAVLAANLRIRAEDLTPALKAALRNAATIHNPAFYEAQAARRSTHGQPRFIQGFDLGIGGDLILPRGLLEQVSGLVASGGSRLQVEDLRNQGAELDVEFAGSLTESQTSAVEAVLAAGDGVLQAPTGSGKTVMACAVMAERGLSTAILIDRLALADQWREQIVSLLGFKPGQLGAGRKKLTALVDIVTLPTLARRPEAEIAELMAPYGQIIVDECPCLGAATYQRAVKSIAAAWWLGLTATPIRRDGLEQLVFWQLGPVRHKVADRLPGESTLEDPRAAPARLLRVHRTDFRAPSQFDRDAHGWIGNLGAVLAADDKRNEQIARDIVAAWEQGRRCLVVTRRRDQIDRLASMLAARGLDPMILRGGTSKKDLAGARRHAAAAKPGEPVLVMTTLPYGGQGLDVPVLDTVFLAGPVSSPVPLIQAVGRAMRLHPDKASVVVHDYADPAEPAYAAQFTKRRRAYRALGFKE